MKFKILAEMSCDDNCNPIYQEENIECTSIFPGDVHIIGIEEKNGRVYIQVKEVFHIFGKDDWRSISKKNILSSKRVGKNALYRCFNCEKADNCKYLIGDSTIIRHDF